MSLKTTSKEAIVLNESESVAYYRLYYGTGKVKPMTIDGRQSKQIKLQAIILQLLLLEQG